mmetsp:Transcript_65549/g.184596  ORF Transcript_65549/g.184596 Transcript_65549/m.184596 type:complete len:391 (+) Transcript_65549:391-1563(+)
MWKPWRGTWGCGSSSGLAARKSSRRRGAVAAAAAARRSAGGTRCARPGSPATSALPSRKARQSPRSSRREGPPDSLRADQRPRSCSSTPCRCAWKVSSNSLRSSCILLSCAEDSHRDFRARCDRKDPAAASSAARSAPSPNFTLLGVPGSAAPPHELSSVPISSICATSPSFVSCSARRPRCSSSVASYSWLQWSCSCASSLCSAAIVESYLSASSSSRCRASSRSSRASSRSWVALSSAATALSRCCCSSCCHCLVWWEPGLAMGAMPDAGPGPCSSSLGSSLAGPPAHAGRSSPPPGRCAARRPSVSSALTSSSSSSTLCMRSAFCSKADFNSLCALAVQCDCCSYISTYTRALSSASWIKLTSSSGLGYAGSCTGGSTMVWQQLGDI